MTNPYAWTDFLSQLQAAWPVSRYRDVGVVVGCSGGADSVALLRGLAASVCSEADAPPAKGFIVVAHFNHGFRGDASREDERFVRGLAHELGLEVEVELGDSDSQDEEAARNRRRDFFRRVVRRRGARYLALGHSLDDNVETYLYRLFRGTGPAGLTGMKPFRTLSDCPEGSDFVIARPMLGIGREPIREALRGQGFSWREDESNRSNRYHRNWIRNELLPLVRQEFPDAVAAIDRAIDGQRQWQLALRPNVRHWIDSVLVSPDPLELHRLDRLPERVRGDSAVASEANPTAPSGQAIAIEALRELWHQRGWPLQAIGQAHWSRLYKLLSGDGPDSITLPGAIEVTRDREHVSFRRR